MEDFPLFPLGIVALPTETVPLHVFEDRYRTMVQECLDGKREFGIVWLSEEELKPIGCACEIERVLERMEDGRLTILVRGTRVFRLLQRQDDLPYPAGIVEFFGRARGGARRRARARRPSALRGARGAGHRPHALR